MFVKQPERALCESVCFLRSKPKGIIESVAVARMASNASHHSQREQLYTVQQLTAEQQRRYYHQQQEREMFADEIKFTRTQSCTPSSCACLMIALLFILSGATSGIYYGREYTIDRNRITFDNFIRAVKGYEGRAPKGKTHAPVHQLVCVCV